MDVDLLLVHQRGAETVLQRRQKEGVARPPHQDALEDMISLRTNGGEKIVWGSVSAQGGLVPPIKLGSCAHQAGVLREFHQGHSLNLREGSHEGCFDVEVNATVEVMFNAHYTILIIKNPPEK